jgi:hypothetical protein
VRYGVRVIYTSKGMSKNFGVCVIHRCALSTGKYGICHIWKCLEQIQGFILTVDCSVHDPLFVPFRGERWKISGQWHGFWSCSPPFSKLLRISYLTKCSSRKVVNGEVVYFNYLNAGVWCLLLNLKSYRVPNKCVSSMAVTCRRVGFCGVLQNFVVRIIFKEYRFC